MEPVFFDTTEDCLRALLSDEVDQAYINTYSASYLMTTPKYRKFDIVQLQNIPFEISIGVSREQDRSVISLLNKSIDSLSTEEINAIIIRNTLSSQDITLMTLLSNMPYEQIMMIVILLLAVMVGVILSVMYRRRKRMIVAAVTKEYERFIRYVCMANSDVSEINLLTHTRIRYSIENGMVCSRSEDYGTLEEMLSAIHPDDIDSVRKKIDFDTLLEIINRTDEIYFEGRTLDKDGEYRWYAYMLQGVERDKAHPDNVMMYKRDIDKSKRKETEHRKELEEALVSAQSASMAKGRFLSNMSHEMRTPLNAVIGYLTIAKSSDDIEKVGSCIDKSEVAAKHLLSIINDVLDMSAIENGKIRICGEGFDLRGVITSVSLLFSSQAQAKGVAFDAVVYDIDCEQLVGDQLRLNQILMNLLSNAVKFTTDGGQVRLYVSQLRGKREDGSGIITKLVVTDTGIGMDEEFLERLFNPFEQESASTARIHGGSGLGLSITKNLIDMMGGSITVASLKNVGTTVTVELPFGCGGGAAEQTEKYPAARVLIVNRNSEAAGYIGAVASECGLTADAADSGEEAVRIISEGIQNGRSYDICIIDGILPDMNGFEAAKRIRDICGERPPVTAVSVCDRSSADCSDGADRLISKPLFRSDIISLLEEVLSGRRPDSRSTAFRKSFKGVRVLLVEDNAMNLEIAKELLARDGFTVECAVNGKIAVDMFTESPAGYYSLILMDIQMPVMDGCTATKEIRDSFHPRAKEVPIIAMTANAFADDVARVLECGMNAHASKPIDFNQLYAIIERYVPSKTSNASGIE